MPLFLRDRSEPPSASGNWLLLVCSSDEHHLLFSILGVRANRYQVDGQAPLILGTVLVAAAIWNMTRGAGVLAGVWKFGWAVFAVVAVLCNILGSIQQFDQFRFTHPKTFEAASAALNPSWKTLKKWRLARQPPGPLALDVIFRPQTKRVDEPLLTTRHSSI